MSNYNTQIEIGTTNNRNFGLDLFRILLAFMVLSLHFNAGATGKVLINATEAPWKWLAGGMTTLCYPAVNCYVLISGYFMYKQKADLRKQVKSLSKLWLTILFYSVFGYCCVVAMFGVEFGFFDLIKRCFPISRGKWWFFTVYFGISLMAPFINIMLNGLDKKYRKMLIIQLLVMCSLIPMFTNWEEQLGSNYGYSLLWFFVLYITGAYIAEFIDIKITDENRSKFMMMSFAFYIVISAVTFCSGPILGKIGIAVSLAPYNSLFTYAQAISLFLFFRNIRIKKVFRNIIVGLSNLSLATYMFHCQEDIERVLWSNLKPWEYANSFRIMFVYLVTISSLFVVSLLIESIRSKVIKALNIEKKFTMLTDKIYIYILRKL